MLLNAPPALDETQQSHGQVRYLSEDLRLSGTAGPGPDMAQCCEMRKLWSCPTDGRWRACACTRKQEVLLPPQCMWNFHRPWGGLSDLMQPCSCVCVCLWGTVSLRTTAGKPSHVACSFLLHCSWFPSGFVLSKCRHSQVASFCGA